MEKGAEDSIQFTQRTLSGEEADLYTAEHKYDIKDDWLGTAMSHLPLGIIILILSIAAYSSIVQHIVIDQAFFWKQQCHLPTNHMSFIIRWRIRRGISTRSDTGTRE